MYHAVNTNAEFASGASIFFARCVPTMRSNRKPSNREKDAVAVVSLAFFTNPAPPCVSPPLAAANSTNSAKYSGCSDCQQKSVSAVWAIA
jgi:hypothetical protein